MFRSSLERPRRLRILVVSWRGSWTFLFPKPVLFAVSVSQLLMNEKVGFRTLGSFSCMVLPQQKMINTPLNHQPLTNDSPRIKPFSED